MATRASTARSGGVWTRLTARGGLADAPSIAFARRAGQPRSAARQSQTVPARGATEGGDTSASRPSPALRYADLAILAVALPVFVLVGASMLGYLVAAVAWIVQRAIQLAADRAAAQALASGVRRNALGMLAASTLARLWVVTLAILLVGTLGSSKAGLAAAILSLILVTVSLGTRALIHALHPEDAAR